MSRSLALEKQNLPPRKRPPLSRTRIARGALALMDRGGLDAFSLRGLAARLRVEPMSLYHHLPNKDAILDAVMELMVEEIQIPMEGHWIERLRAAAWSYRALAMRHPGAFRLLVVRPYRTDRLLKFCDDLLRIYQEAGLDPRSSAMLFRILGHWLDGAALYTSEGPGKKGKVPPLVPVDPGRYPALAVIGPHLSRALAEAHFEWGLERMLAEVQREARRLRAAHRKVTE